MGYFALGCYIVLAAGFIGLRYWVLPNIDQWREPLQRQLSSMLDVQVELGRVSADWWGMHPRLRIADLQLRDKSGFPLLNIPYLRAVVSWQSLLSRGVRLVEVQAEGVALTVRRDIANGVHILGREVHASGASQESPQEAPTNFTGWLAEQGNVSLTNASVRWIDETRAAPPLELDRVVLTLRREGKGHRLSMMAEPPAELGRSLSLQAHFDWPRSEYMTPTLSQLNGLLYVGVEAMQPAAWQPWLDPLAVLQQGQVSWHAWQEFQHGNPRRHVTQISADHAVWMPTEGTRVAADSVMLHLDGPWSELKEIWSGASPNPSVGVTTGPFVKTALKLQGATVDIPDVFDSTLVFNAVTLQGAISHEEDVGLRLSAERLQLRNADMDVEAQGNWHERGGEWAGMIDVEGTFRRAQLSAIVRYLPVAVDEEAREWMRHGLLAGELLQAQAQLRGDLFHFPFGAHPEAGEFKVSAVVKDALIDFAPERVVGTPAWPPLEKLNGRAELRNVDLQIFGDTVEMRPDGKSRIALRDVKARIPDIEHQSQLSVEGFGQAEASAFLTLLRHSPLAKQLRGMFDNAQGKGVWEVPISLKIPLSDPDDTEVDGAVLFKDAALQLAPIYPALSNLNGRLAFNEGSVTAHDLKATLLGGPTTVSGGLGTAHKALSFKGTLEADALGRFLQGRVQGLLSGSTPYQLHFTRNAAGDYGANLHASLEGLALHLPPPLRKSREAAWPLIVQWTPPAGKKPGLLDVSLNKQLSAQFLRGPGAGAGSFFRAGAVNLGGKPAVAGQGLTLDLAASELDVDAWRELLSVGVEPAGKSGAAQDIFPPARDIRVQADRARALGTDLNQFTFTARRPEGDRWRVDVSSTETAGTLFWQERQGRIQGSVEAHFERLTLGDSDDGPDFEQPRAEGQAQEAASTWDMDGEVDIPAIRLRVDRMRMYGRDLGSVSLVGVNEARQRRWKLEQLEIGSPHASLKGQGVWELDGPNQGLRLKAEALFDDFGSYLDQLGFTNLVQGGHGSVRGDFEWRGIPRRFDRAGLYGELDVDLAKGRFVSVSSRSGRLLELLSLQSVKRLAKLDWNPGGLTKQGFPFDTVQGQIKGDAGVLHSENYRVTSPVATIVMAGDANLVDETLDIYAVVVPTFDVSGAAIAAGIAVNPIVGLGAFLTQWLLKDPVSKAMTVEYRVKGTFDQPELVEINTK